MVMSNIYTTSLFQDINSTTVVARGMKHNGRKVNAVSSHII